VAVTKPELEMRGGLATDSPVGPRLRRLRRLRGATLQEVAREAGISHSFLSMVERGKADVALSRLTRLAKIYGVTLSELFAEEGPGARPVIVSDHDMLAVDRGPGITYRYWTAATVAGEQLIHVCFEPGAGFRDLLAHRGEDFVWVIRGELTLMYGSDDYRVPAGKAVAYAATVPHAFRNPTRRKAELVALTTHTYW
jgi:transcriptional regulator with XRE-family HTH domain